MQIIRITSFGNRIIHLRELFNNKMMDEKLEYIHNNPVEAGFVAGAEEYMYSSARDYSGENGMVELRLME